MGLLGILLAAMMAGLNNRVPGLTLADVQGALGYAQDDASWLNTAYSAGELATMPFATWFAITYSLRRMHCWTLGISLVIAALLPFAHSLALILVLRTLQGIFAGALIPVLMMAALRFLPPPIRLHGLALYAMTATFAPNVALWLAALFVDRLEDWRWVYWHVIPIGLAAMALVYWGIPKMPMALPRLKQANWIGMALGIPGLALVVVGLDQGVRLDWFESPIIVGALSAGLTLTALFLISEGRHPAPFMRLQLLKRRNLALGFSIFFCMLITMSTAVALPANLLGHLHGFRMEQIAPIGLIVGLPQLVLGSAVALLLYQRWVDARYLFALGLACISAACWLASGLTSEWMVAQLVPAEVLQTIGQPLAVVSLLFLSTSVVVPMEGAFVSGIINTLRAFGTVFGSALIGQLMTLRNHFHSEVLLDQANLMAPRLAQAGSAIQTLTGTLAEQANVLAAADIYHLFALVALALVPLALCMQHIPAPTMTPPPIPPTPKPAATQPVAAH
jgi:DHA2 family multidrug resistance protein